MSVPDPVSVSFSAAEEAAWYARLPTMFAAAAALFTSADGRVLLVKPNYRDHWSLPGGILDKKKPSAEDPARQRPVIPVVRLDQQQPAVRAGEQRGRGGEHGGQPGVPRGLLGRGEADGNGIGHGHDPIRS